MNKPVDNSQDTNISSFWEIAINKLKSELNPQSFDTWIKPLKLLSKKNDTATIEVPSAFFKEWITYHYKQLIETLISRETNSSINLEFVVAPLKAAENLPLFSASEAKAVAEDSIPDNSLTVSSMHTFENFVVGNSNRFAHAVSLAVAEVPAKNYNPFLIYGGVGLGKTHLLHAIGNFIKKQNPKAKVIYLTSEMFMNEMISAIRISYERVLSFRGKYRNVDVLLIDDIQFLEGKESTQEEFFHTFNALYEANHQIVASSDSHPKEVKIEERLRSRFEMGLVADIQSPDFETRVAILMKKAELKKARVPQDVIAFLASNFTSNIRKLEGSLTSILAYSSINKKNITIDLAREALKDVLEKEEPEAITIDKIKKAVVEYFNLKLSDMTAKQRTKSITFPRQIAMYLARELTECSLPEIGQHFGGRDHTTVIYAYELIKKRLTVDTQTNKQVNDIVKVIKGEKKFTY